jgi:predicted transcriptional regulator
MIISRIQRGTSSSAVSYRGNMVGLYDNMRLFHNSVMSLSRSRTSRVFTISFPEDLATQVEEVARQESRNISELFREAFRTYRLERIQRKLSATRAAVAARTGPRDTEEDVEQLVDEIRTVSFDDIANESFNRKDDRGAVVTNGRAILS